MSTEVQLPDLTKVFSRRNTEKVLYVRKLFRIQGLLEKAQRFFFGLIFVCIVLLVGNVALIPMAVLGGFGGTIMSLTILEVVLALFSLLVWIITGICDQRLDKKLTLDALLDVFEYEALRMSRKWRRPS